MVKKRRNKLGIISLILLILIIIAGIWFFTSQTVFQERGGYVPKQVASVDVCGEQRYALKYVDMIPVSVPSTSGDSCSDDINGIIKWDKMQLDLWQYTMKRTQEQPTQVRIIYKDGSQVDIINQNNFVWSDGKVKLGKSDQNLIGGIDGGVATLTFKKGDFFEGENNRIEVIMDSEVTDSVLLWAWIEEQRSGRIWDLSKAQFTLNKGLNSMYLTIPDDTWPAAYNLNVVLVSNTYKWVMECKDCGGGSGAYPVKYGWKHLQLAPLKDELFLINPKPIFISKDEGDSCPSGYSPQGGSSTTLCVRDDLISFPCTQLKCPFGYECQSDGICSQQIYEYTGCTSDSQCSSDATCDEDTGICWKTNVVTHIEYQIREKTVNCNEIGCPVGGICDTFTGVCVKETEKVIIDSKDCTDNPAICANYDATCDSVTGMCVRTVRIIWTVNNTIIKNVEVPVVVRETQVIEQPGTETQTTITKIVKEVPMWIWGLVAVLLVGITLTIILSKRKSQNQIR